MVHFLHLKSFRRYVVLALALLGCSCLPTGNWLVGTWEFDRAATEAYLKPASESAGGLKKLLDGVSGAVGGVVASAMAGHLEGTKMQITGDEIRHIAQDGTVKAVSYQILERSDANTITLQVGSGEKMTFRRQGASVWRVIDDKDRARLFLKRG